MESLTDRSRNVLELKNIRKTYPGVVANDDINLAVKSGEIHALIGENGAGKTTLMSILYGLIKPDSGSITVDSELQSFRNPTDAIASGLGMVHQAFYLFPSLTVAENIIFQDEPTKRGFIDLAAAIEKIKEISDHYGLAIDPNAKIENLAVGVLQRVEIVKALYRNTKILILDEPTAVLTPQERDHLFKIIRKLREEGCTILFITHKLGEVMDLADTVTVLRRGRTVWSGAVVDTTPREMSHHMTGRNVDLERIEQCENVGEPVLVLDGVTVTPEDGVSTVKNVSFELRAGEIVGIAGVAGNGQNELVEAIMGLRDVSSGTIRIQGKDISNKTVRQRRRAGIAYVPENRERVGTARHASIWENLLMGFQRDKKLTKNNLISRSRAIESARDQIARSDIRTSGPTANASTLSGGNLQKVVMSRELEHRAPVFIAEQPTRGVDIGAIESLWSEIQQARDQGAAVLLISAELIEIQALSTRILVMYEGAVVAELDPELVSESDIGFHMAGGDSNGG